MANGAVALQAMRVRDGAASFSSSSDQRGEGSTSDCLPGPTIRLVSAPSVTGEISKSDLSEVKGQKQKGGELLPPLISTHLKVADPSYH